MLIAGPSALWKFPFTLLAPLGDDSRFARRVARSSLPLTQNGLEWATRESSCLAWKR